MIDKIIDKYMQKHRYKIVRINILDGSNATIGRFSTMKSCNRALFLLEKFASSNSLYEYYMVRS